MKSHQRPDAEEETSLAGQADSQNAGTLYFQVFKYIIYFLLIRNIWLFYVDESAAAALMESDGVTLNEVINVYAATIDTFFWVVLLLLFELETWIIPDERITPRVSALFTACRAVCYASIIYAVWGYTVTYIELLRDWQPVATTLCDQVGQAFMFSLERFETITTANCASLATSTDILVSKHNLYVDSAGYGIAELLAIADVVNASAWLLVVLILEIEVRMQLSGRLQQGASFGIIVTKIVLYGTLVFVAAFWGIYGIFIDFWDAFLWIVAFVFIESNMVQWNRETRAVPA